MYYETCGITETVNVYTWLYMSFVFHLFFSYGLASLAGRHFGNPMFWYICFLLAPGVAHGVCLLIYLISIRKIRLHAKTRSMFDLFYHSLYLEQYLVSKRDPNEDVTPFVQNVIEVSTGKVDILEKWHDKKIDELIEWREWGPAYRLTIHKLRKSRQAGDKGSVHVYQAYLTLLSPYIDTSRFLPGIPTQPDAFG